jgi:uncharacterized membrane protein YjfL (UPF0719 family)
MDTREILESIIMAVVGWLPFVAMTFVIVGLAKLVFDWRTPFDDTEQLDLNNHAASWTRGGAYLGIMLATLGSLLTHDVDYWARLGLFLLDGVWAILVFTVASIIFDLVILRRANNCDEIVRGNLAVGVIECFAYTGLGTVMFAAFAGQDRQVPGEAFNMWSFLEGQLSGLVFSFLGLFTVVAAYWVYTRVMYLRSGRSFHIDRAIHGGDLAAAIDAGSFLLAISVTLWFSIYGPFNGWLNDVVSYFVAALAAVIAVAAGSLVARPLLLNDFGERKRHDRSARSDLLIRSTPVGNAALAIKVACVRVGIGFLVGLLTFVG